MGLNPPLEEVEETTGALQSELWCVACLTSDEREVEIVRRFMLRRNKVSMFTEMPDIKVGTINSVNIGPLTEIAQE